MIPILKGKGEYRYLIPSLSGGINVSDSRKSNQAQDAQNLYFKNGVLKTRPAVTVSKNEEKPSSMLTENVKISRDKINYKGREYVIKTSVCFRESISQAEGEIEHVDISLINNDSAVLLGTVTMKDCDTVGLSALTVNFNGDIYLYLHYKHISSEENTNEIWVIKRKTDGEYSAPEFKEEAYAPLIMTGCYSCYGMADDKKSLLLNGGEMLEGFNLLGNSYRIRYSTFDASENGYRVNPSDVDENGNHIDPLAWYSFMEYSLPFTTKRAHGRVRAEYMDVKGVTHVHSLVLSGEAAVEEEKGDDGLYMHAYFRGDTCRIVFNGYSEADRLYPSSVYMSDYIHNNLTFTAPLENSSLNQEKVTLMTEQAWYGNTSLGLNGGSRLFLAGNKSDREKALVVWSDFENPLYFSENNYVYVGDRDKRVTALARQGASLIIFKENEIYSTQYVQGGVTDNLSTVDISVRLATFPTVLINSGIGCPYPESIQLCLNRLVFLSNLNTVCVLMGQNQFSERNVYTVSENISRLLKNEQASGCTSLDYDGHYLLFIKNQAFLMNYNSYGYVNISSFTKTSDANTEIPWFRWCFLGDISFARMINNRGTVMFSDGGTGVLNEDVGEDTVYTAQVPIGIMLFLGENDLTLPDRLKTLKGLSMTVNAKAGIKVSLSEFDRHYVLTLGKDEYESIWVIPFTRLVKSIGIRLEGAGIFRLKGIEVRFKQGAHLR